MPRQSTRAKPTPALPAFVPPYPPSWVDRLADLVDRLPGPAWLTYLVLGMAAVLLHIAIQISAGDYRPGPLLPLHILMFGSFAYALAMIHYLDRSAASAIEAFRPILELSPPGGHAQRQNLTYGELRYRLTTLPARTTAWVAVLGGIALTAPPLLLFRIPGGGQFSVALVFDYFGLSAAPLPAAALFLENLLWSAIIVTLVYHTIHQLRLIQHITANHTRVNLYRLQPLYAFSVTAALTAGGFFVLSYAFFAATPFLPQQPAILGGYIVLAGIGLVTFVMPFWGIHRRLVEEKKRLTEESSSRFESAVAQLHQRVDRQQLTRMDDLNKTLASLEIEQSVLRRIPTWPWEPGTVRAVVAALLLPVFIWLVQQLLGRFLAG